MGDSEAAKLQKHLNLLRQEYVKLQNKNLELEQKLSLASAASGDVNEESFISQLMHTANDLYDKETYSDITVCYSGKKVRSHKVILTARSDCWCDGELADLNELELTDVSVEVGNTLIKWVYTDKADIRNDESFIMELVRAANRYKLRALRGRCERILMSSVSVTNCIRFYQTAEDIGADALKKYCAEIIANHWDDLQTEDFVGMSAPLLYDMFKAKSSYPLHFAIRHHREDVVFLYLIEFNLRLPGKLDEVEPQTGLLPLEIALNERQESIAETLVQHKCDINAPDSDGRTLLHKSIEVGDDYAAMFLIKHGADVKAVTSKQNETPLHLAAKYQPLSVSSKTTTGDGMTIVSRLLLDHGVNINAVDVNGRTAIHCAVAAQNEDVFTVLLAERSLDLEVRDNNGHVVLWFAILSTKKDLREDTSDSSFAARLVKQGSSSDAVNHLTGDSLLHMSAASKNESAGLFLIDRGAQVNHTNNNGESPLHIASKNGLVQLVDKLLKSGCNPNIQTIETEILKTQTSARQLEFLKKCEEAKHRIIMLEKSKATKRCRELKEARDLEENKKRTVSQQKLVKQQPKEEEINPFLDENNAYIDVSNPFHSNSRSNSVNSASLNPFSNPAEDEPEMNPFLEEGTSFFDEMQAASSAAMALTSNIYDNQEIIKTNGVASNANQNITTFNGRIDEKAIRSPTQVEKFDFDKMHVSNLDIEDGLHPDVITECWNQTPMHMAVTEKHKDVVKCFIDQSNNASRGGIGGRMLISPDFNLCDSADQTILWIALLTKQYEVAKMLIDADANINAVTQDQQTLLHKAISRRDLESCVFLLENGADIDQRNKEDMSALQMAIHLHLLEAVEALCKRGVNVNSSDARGNTPLLIALKSKQTDIATSLVKYGADTTAWNIGVNNCSWSLLHRAIYENDEETACFLIRNGCDVNSARKPGTGDQGGAEAWDGLTPLHLSCAAAQDQVVQCLVERSADVNAQDSEGRSPIHIAITTKNPIITHILLSHPEVNFSLKDRLGQTPFVVAMNCRDNEASAAILAREPSAAEQFDNKGRNYLHMAVSNNDVDSVLFLISIEVNVNSRIQDGSHRTPLHLAVPTGSEIIVRHLILAGADVNGMDKNRQCPVQIAAIEDKAAILEVLLQNNANPDLVDSNLNNALHLSCQYGNIATVRVLLTESNINAEAYNAKGQNPLHVLSSYSRENAAAIFDLFRQTMPNYPFDALDTDENTALFLAYTNGAVGLCCALLKAGARLGTMNKHGVSIFNAPVATKKLLFRLLDLLNSEPAWSDGPNCHECGQKFNVTTRKHHCRHCGRLLCSKCSQQQMPILKYELSKPVRVCGVCFDFLTSGVQGQ